MNNKSIYLMIITTLFCISLTGCGTLDKNLGILSLQSKKTVENNVFSSSFPEIKLQISQDLKYLGSAQLVETTDNRMSWNTNAGENVEAISYLFGQIDRNNRVANGVLIRLLSMHGDPSQAVPAIFSKSINNVLESGEMKILEEKYQYDLYAEGNLFTRQENGLLATNRVPSCFLVKQLLVRAGFGNKSRVQILYFEDASNTCGDRPCGTCLDSRNSTADQKQTIKGFIDRSYANIRFLKTRTVEDTTFRYVDVEPKPQPVSTEKAQPTLPEITQPAPAEKVRPTPVVIVPVAPVEKAPPAPVAESIKADAAEKRLEALKRVYEKNLISKEDYEKKKAEILKEL